jgi:hypothetical protein
MAPLLAAILVAAAPAPEASRAVRAALDVVAARIAVLKARRLAGADVADELEPLLVRAQRLAAEIERLEAPGAPRPPPAAGPSPEELHERADALRDDADRAAAALVDVDREVEDARRAAAVEAGLASLESESDLFGDTGMARLPQRSGGQEASTTGISGSGGGPGAAATPRTSALAPSGAAARNELPLDPAARLRALRALRTELEARIASLRGEADRLEAQARALAAQE